MQPPSLHLLLFCDPLRALPSQVLRALPTLSSVDSVANHDQPHLAKIGYEFCQIWMNWGQILPNKIREPRVKFSHLH